MIVVELGHSGRSIHAQCFFAHHDLAAPTAPANPTQPTHRSSGKKRKIYKAAAPICSVIFIFMMCMACFAAENLQFIAGVVLFSLISVTSVYEYGRRKLSVLLSGMKSIPPANAAAKKPNKAAERAAQRKKSRKASKRMSHTIQVKKKLRDVTLLDVVNYTAQGASLSCVFCIISICLYALTVNQSPWYSTSALFIGVFCMIYLNLLILRFLRYGHRRQFLELGCTIFKLETSEDAKKQAKVTNLLNLAEKFLWVEKEGDDKSGNKEGGARAHRRGSTVLPDIGNVRVLGRRGSGVVPDMGSAEGNKSPTNKAGDGKEPEAQEQPKRRRCDFDGWSTHQSTRPPTTHQPIHHASTRPHFY